MLPTYQDEFPPIWSFLSFHNNNRTNCDGPKSPVEVERTKEAGISKTTRCQSLSNIKDKDKPRNKQGVAYKINCSNCHASYISETGRNLTTGLIKHKRARRKGDINNHIAEHHRRMNHTVDWDSAQCLTYSTNYFQRLTLESWFTTLEQTPLNRCQPLPAPYKQLIHDINITNELNRMT